MPVFNSSAIRRAEYDPSNLVLKIWFVQTGGPYDYYSVPESVYLGLCNASSQGTYFARYIRDQYSSRR